MKNFHFKDPQTLGATTQNLVFCPALCPEFLFPSFWVLVTFVPMTQLYFSLPSEILIIQKIFLILPTHGFVCATDFRLRSK